MSASEQSMGSTALTVAVVAVVGVDAGESLRAPVEARRGELSTLLGGGLVAVFGSVSDAARAAVSLRSLLRQTSSGVGVGLAVGDAVREEGGWIGPPLTEAVELSRAAPAGSIQPSEVAALLAGDLLPPSGGEEPVTGGGRTDDQGSGPNSVAGPGPAVGSDAVNPVLAVDTPGFVGREKERALLAAAWQEARAGKARWVFVSGEAGMGKTRLAGEAARRVASAGGALVLYGRSDEDLRVPYGPFIELLDELTARLGPEAVAGLAGEALEDVAPLLSFHRPVERQALLEGELPGSIGSPQRSRLLAGVAQLLVAATTTAPLMLVLDDLQWSGRSTVLMVEHLIDLSPGARLLAVVNYRGRELSREHPLSQLLARLRTRPEVERVELAGLGPEAVEELAAGIGGGSAAGGAGRLPAASARRVHEETDGNPFLTVEMLRELASGGTVVPEPVMRFVARRVARLGPAGVEALEIGSVVGNEFELELVETLAAEGAGTGTPAPMRGPETGRGPSDDRVLSGLEEAVAAGLLAEVPGRASRFRFAHALVRQSVYESLPLARRARLHAGLGRLLEGPAPAGRDLAALARHYSLAGAAAPPGKAAHYGRLAAEAAMTSLGFEAAVSNLETAMRLLEDGAWAERAELFLLLSRARLATGDLIGARHAAEGAALAAVRAESGSLLALAAVAAVSYNAVGVLDEEAASLCRQALEQLGEEPSALRVQVQAKLAQYLFWSEGDAPEAERLSAAALDQARRLPGIADSTAAPADEEALVEALLSRGVCLGARPDPVEMEARAQDLLDIAERTGSTQARLSGLRMRSHARLLSGDGEGFVADAVEWRARADRHRTWEHQANATLALATAAAMVGEFQMAEGLGDEVLALAGDALDFRNSYAAQMLFVRREQGRLSELLPLLSVAVAENPRISGFRVALATALAEVGRPQEAMAELTHLSADHFAEVAVDTTYVLSLCLLAEVAAVTGAAEEATELGDLLEPYAGMMVSAGTYVCLGAVDRYRAMAALTAGRHDVADALASAGAALEERAGALAHLARTRYWQARALLSAPAPSAAAVKRARTLIEQARRSASEFGQAGLVSALDSLAANSA